LGGVSNDSGEKDYFDQVCLLLLFFLSCLIFFKGHIFYLGDILENHFLLLV
jgi:hypothetical protein